MGRLAGYTIDLIAIDRYIRIKYKMNYKSILTSKGFGIIVMVITCIAFIKTTKFGAIRGNTFEDITEGFILTQYYFTPNQGFETPKTIILFLSRFFLKHCKFPFLYSSFKSLQTLKMMYLYNLDVNLIILSHFHHLLRVKGAMKNYMWSY